MNWSASTRPLVSPSMPGSSPRTRPRFRWPVAGSAICRRRSHRGAAPAPAELDPASGGRPATPFHRSARAEAPHASSTSGGRRPVRGGTEDEHPAEHRHTAIGARHRWTPAGMTWSCPPVSARRAVAGPAPREAGRSGSTPAAARLVLQVSPRPGSTEPPAARTSNTQKPASANVVAPHEASAAGTGRSPSGGGRAIRVTARPPPPATAPIPAARKADRGRAARLTS